VPVVLADDSDTWSHGVDAFRDEIGAATISGFPEVVESGPVRALVRVWSRWGDSVIERELSLCHGSRALRIDMTVDWQEKHQVLKVAFPVAVERPRATYEIPYGFIGRETAGDEEPGQKWVDVTGRLGAEPRAPQYGLTLLNDCKYGFDVSGAELRMTILRSPIYAFHDPRQREPGRRYDYTDQGVQTLSYAVLPHAGGWRQGRAPREAWELNSPLAAVEEPSHDGPLPPRLSFLELRCRHAIAEVVKRAENDDEIIVRCYETHGRKAQGTIRIQGSKVAQLAFSPFEIKTLRLARDADGWRVAETDMLERPV
jgi:alpha-mannosidase